MTPMPKRPGTAAKSALPGKLERAKLGRVRHEGGAQSTGRAAIPPSVQNDPILRSVTRPAFALIMLLTLLLFWRGPSRRPIRRSLSPRRPAISSSARSSNAFATSRR